VSGILLTIRGTFIEFRTGMINVSPVGRNASSEERNDYEKYDKEHKIREKFIEEIRKKFPDIGLTYSIGMIVRELFDDRRTNFVRLFPYWMGQNVLFASCPGGGLYQYTLFWR
jgi:hypothetical protein